MNTEQIDAATPECSNEVLVLKGIDLFLRAKDGSWSKNDLDEEHPEMVPPELWPALDRALSRAHIAEAQTLGAIVYTGPEFDALVSERDSLLDQLSEAHALNEELQTRLELHGLNR